MNTINTRSAMGAVKTLSLTATGLLAAAAATTTTTTTLAQTGQPKPAARPNIIILMTDQQRWDALSYSYNKTIRTPNIDRLAASGAWFKAAVTQCPVCAPARTSVLTGTTIEKTTVRVNGDANPRNQCPYTSFDQILGDNGWHTEYYGKFHSATKLTAGYKNPEEGGLTGAALILGDKDLYSRLIREKVGKRQPAEGEQPAPSYDKGIFYIPNPMDSRYGKTEAVASTKKRAAAKAAKADGAPKAKKSADEDGGDEGDGSVDVHGALQITPDLTLTAFTAGRALEALDRVGKTNQPFTLTCSIVAPHPPILPAAYYDKQYDPKQMPIPPNLQDKMTNNPYYAAVGRLQHTEYANPDKIGYFIGNYYAYVSEVDVWIGKILDKVEALGLKDNTIIVYLSDHGEMLGSHGMRGKTVFLEESVRVPLIISYPGVIPAGKIIDAPVSTIDIYPTLLELAGVKSSPRDGYSLMPLIRGEKPKYDFAVSEWSIARKAAVPNIMIRNKDWKLFMSYDDNQGKCDALFDLKNDPYEMNNLLGKNPDKSKYKATATKLQADLVGYLKDIKHPYANAVEQRRLF